MRGPGRIGALLVVAALVACARDPYARAGCRGTHPLPPLPAAAGVGPIDLGILCDIDDDARTVPDCDALAAIYLREAKPTRVYAIVVARHSSYDSECKRVYSAAGASLGELPHGD